MVQATFNAFVDFAAVTSRKLQWYYSTDLSGEVTFVAATTRDSDKHITSALTGQGVTVADLPADAIRADSVS